MERNGYTDLAFPQYFQTSNWGVEGGYQTSKATFAIRWDYSKFDNDYESFRWTNPYFGPTSTTTGNLLDTTYLAPDNSFNKFTHFLGSGKLFRLHGNLLLHVWRHGERHSE